MLRFYANPYDTFISSNGAIGYRPGGPMGCLGPPAKVKNCPVMVEDREVARLTCYAQGYADTSFSIPAATRYKGVRVKGYFTSASDDSGTIFRVMDSSKHLFQDSQKDTTP